MIAVQVGRIELGCDFYENEGCFCKIFGVHWRRHASTFSRGVRGGEQGRVGFNQADPMGLLPSLLHREKHRRR